MLIEIERDIEGNESTLNTGVLYVNPANVMTLEASMNFTQTDVLGTSFAVEFHMILNQKDFLLCKKSIKREDIHKGEVLESICSGAIAQVEILKEAIANLDKVAVFDEEIKETKKNSKAKSSS